MTNIRRELQAAAGVGGAGLDVEDVFKILVYAGDNSTRTFVTGLDLLNDGGLVLNKVFRGVADDSALVDTERGAGQNLFTNKQDDQDGVGGLTAFTSTGYTTNAWTIWNGLDSYDYLSYSFRKEPGFFDVVKWAGDSTTRDIAHNLGSTPGCIWIKCYDTNSTDWVVWHKGIPLDYIYLNSDAVAAAAGYTRDVNSATFEVTDLGNENETGRNYVAYVFGHDDESFGPSGDESIIYCGTTGGNFTLPWEPQFFLVKSEGYTTDWQLVDSMHGLFGYDSLTSPTWEPNQRQEEDTSPSNDIFVQARGGGVGSFAGTGIYIAIRRPMREPSAATEVYSEVAYSGDNTADRAITVGTIFSDTGSTAWDGLYLSNRLNATYVTRWQPRILGKYFEAANSDALYASNDTDYQFMDKITGDAAYQNETGTNYLSSFFQRAYKFLDLCPYTGTATASGETFPHSLGVAPEMVIYKKYTAAPLQDWYVTHKDLTDWDYFLKMNEDDAQAQDSTAVGSAAPTASVFSVGDGTTGQETNGNGFGFIAHCMATLAGISKVGSYSGTGSAVNVACGFSAGARFIMIKRADSTGDWFIFSTVQGIVAGNDAYYILNTFSPQVTGVDYIDPLSAGFTVTAAAPVGLNDSGGTYIFWAIA